jgi:hypothetical protein
LTFDADVRPAGGCPARISPGAVADRRRPLDEIAEHVLERLLDHLGPLGQYRKQSLVLDRIVCPNTSFIEPFADARGVRDQEGLPERPSARRSGSSGLTTFRDHRTGRLDQQLFALEIAAPRCDLAST